MPEDLASFGKGISLAIDSLVSPIERRALIQQAADDLLEATRREIREAGGGSPPYRIMVDGQPATSLNGISSDHGVILFWFEGAVVVDLVQTTLALLRENSPVLTGRYRASHRIYADGLDVTDDMPISDKQAVGVKEFTIMPTVPYARKLEKLDGVYEGTTAVLQRRFDNSAAVYFEYRSPILPYVAGAANREDRQRLRGQASRRAAILASRRTRLPCISITPLER